MGYEDCVLSYTLEKWGEEDNLPLLAGVKKLCARKYGGTEEKDLETDYDWCVKSTRGGIHRCHIWTVDNYMNMRHEQTIKIGLN